MAGTRKLAVLGGDGTGPEVAAEGLKVLQAISKSEGLKFDVTHLDWGGDRYLKTGEALPADGLDQLRKFDAILLGAVGHPEVKPGILERKLLLDVRFGLDQYINLRPVKLFPGVETPLKDKKPEDIDFIVVRENTEDLYCGAGGFMHKGTPNEVATQTAIYTRKGCERAIRYAFELCKKRNNPKGKKLTLVAKTNVLTTGHDLWWRTFQEVGEEYPDIEKDYNHVDACCMWIVKNPEFYDVIVTTNMFGDIITDLSGIIQGGMGVAAGGNINPEGVSMFEPMGGSAPKYTGTGKINPIAAINAVSMLLDQLGEAKAAKRVLDAIMKVTATKMKSQAAGKMGYTTSEVGDLVCEAL